MFVYHGKEVMPAQGCLKEILLPEPRAECTSGPGGGNVAFPSGLSHWLPVQLTGTPDYQALECLGLSLQLRLLGIWRWGLGS